MALLKSSLAQAYIKSFRWGQKPDPYCDGAPSYKAHRRKNIQKERGELQNMEMQRC